jgi:hypothetical protein
MSATTEQAIARLDTAEYDLVAALAGIPGAGGMREKALEVLGKVRATKRALLARSPEILRKSARSLAGHPEVRRARTEPHWRGLPVVEGEVTAMVKAARDRQSEERRLAKTSGQATPERDALAALKQTLAQPIAGSRAVINFLSRAR